MLEPMVSLMSQFGACIAKVGGDRQRDTHTPSTVTLAARRGLTVCGCGQWKWNESDLSLPNYCY